ncbi:MAG: antitoxin [Kiritimatiellae bacterium]|nr:antitoxin [Kiritimatiellia bacterium]MDD3546148.1 antitoxin [Kiritimatiellia bacterium]NLC83360.1 antitoxin [Lentisphaerota bacterium]
MVKTQIQLSDTLYAEAKRIAREREISFAEVVRRGVEYVTRIYPPLERNAQQAWHPPKPVRLGEFQSAPEDWRLMANE